MSKDANTSEKPSVSQDEVSGVETPSAPSLNVGFYNECIEAFTPEQQKNIIHKIDRRLVITLGLLYAVSLMDRHNMGVVMISGMSVDLDMHATRYSIIVLLFFVPYVLFQPVATVVLRKLGPRTFLSIAALLWGLTTISSGFVKNWSDLIPLRLLLGFCEAGFFPSCAYLLSCWYPRYDLQKRNAVFYLIGTVVSAFSGILALGFSQLEGSGSGPTWWGRIYTTKQNNGSYISKITTGIAGWRWIFILQGILTCVAALVAYIFVLGFPDVANAACGFRLDKKEAAFVVARIELDRQDASPEKFNLKKYLAGALDLKIWGFAAIFGLNSITSMAMAYFLPIIFKDGMGFSVAASQCLTAPPYVVAGILMYIVAYYSDKYRIRSPFIIFNGCCLLIGLPLLGFTTNPAVRYVGAFITTVACKSNTPCVLTWQANNIRGQWKRALCSATLVGSGGIGGIVGSLVFRSTDAPTYRLGMIVSIAASALTIVITLLLDLKFIRGNRRAAAGGKLIGGLEGFRYTL